MFRRSIVSIASAAVLALCAVVAPARADLIKQSSSYGRTILMTSSSNHISGVTGLASAMTITISKASGSYATITPTVTELGNGVYSVALASGNTGTIGALDMHVTASGADPTDAHDQIVGFDPTSDLGAAALATNATAVAALPAAVWGYSTGRTLTTAFPTNFSSFAITSAGLVSLNLAQSLDLTQIGAVDTVGAALNGAHAGITKAVLSGTPGSAGSTLVIYAGNGTTILKTYDLSTAGSKL